MSKSSKSSTFAVRHSEGFSFGFGRFTFGGLSSQSQVGLLSIALCQRLIELLSIAQCPCLPQSSVGLPSLLLLLLLSLLSLSLSLLLLLLSWLLLLLLLL